MGDAIIGASAVLTGIVLEFLLSRWRERWQREQRREERAEMELERWREKSAEAVGAIRDYLVDTHPSWVLARATKENIREQFLELESKRVVVEPPLGIVAAGHPSAAARALADDLRGSLREIRKQPSWLFPRSRMGSPPVRKPSRP